MRLLGTIRIPITVIIKQPFLRGHVSVRAVLYCPHVSCFHLMDSGDLTCLGHELVTVKPPLCTPCKEVVIGPIV